MIKKFEIIHSKCKKVHFQTFFNQSLAKHRFPGHDCSNHMRLIEVFDGTV